MCSVRCTAFSSLYGLLGGLCGLHTKTLKGYAKGLGYEPGMSFEDAGLERHAWNAVLVAGQWRLVDAMWGSLYATPAFFIINSHYDETGSLDFRSTTFYIRI